MRAERLREYQARNAEIVERAWSGEPGAQIARDLGLSRSRVYQIIGRANILKAISDLAVELRTEESPVLDSRIVDTVGPLSRWTQHLVEDPRLASLTWRQLRDSDSWWSRYSRPGWLLLSMRKELLKP